MAGKNKKCKEGYTKVKNKCVKRDISQSYMTSRNVGCGGGGVGFVGLLTLLLIGLKLGKVISWSWWWVLSPLWISFGLGIISFVIFIIIFKFWMKK